MSKSHPETIIDPLQVITEYGTDALRFALIQNMSAGNDQRLGRSKIITNRNFCNKIWNIARYIEGVIDDATSRQAAKPETAADHWILYKLRTNQQIIEKALDEFRFSEAYDTLYHFVWDDLADWYIEASKAAPNKPLLAYLLEATLTLAHPFAPFLTETIWQTLAWEQDSILAVLPLQPITDSDTKQAADFEAIKVIVTEVRLITKAMKVKGATLSYKDAPFIRDNAGIIKQLTHLSEVSQGAAGTGLHLTGTRYPVWLNVDNKAAQTYLRELQTKQGRQIALIKQLKQRLDNASYVQGAPKEVVDQTKAQLKEAEELLSTWEAEMQRFTFTPSVQPPSA
jgi:valyl-tRNA synthetase